MSTVSHLHRAFEAVVLRAYPSRESDLVLHLFGPEVGKISVLAKSIRGSKKRFGALDLFDRGTVELHQGKGSLPLLTSFLPLPGWPALRRDLDALALASLLTECVDNLLHEESSEDGQFYHSYLQALNDISSADELRARLTALFHSIGSLLSTCGYAEHTAEVVPTRNNLRSLLDRVEGCMERRLASRQAVEEILSNLTRPSMPLQNKEATKPIP